MKMGLSTTVDGKTIRGMEKGFRVFQMVVNTSGSGKTIKKMVKGNIMMHLVKSYMMEIGRII
jgi:hypothetical protein